MDRSDLLPSPHLPRTDLLPPRQIKHDEVPFPTTVYPCLPPHRRSPGLKHCTTRQLRTTWSCPIQLVRSPHRMELRSYPAGGRYVGRHCRPLVLDCVRLDEFPYSRDGRGGYERLPHCACQSGVGEVSLLLWREKRGRRSGVGSTLVLDLFAGE